MSYKYNNNNNVMNSKPYNNKYQTQYNHYGPSHYKFDSGKYEYNYPVKKPHGYPYHHQKPQFPSFSYRQYNGFDDCKTYKYTKKGQPYDEKMMSSCSTGSSEEDNNNQKQHQQNRVTRPLMELDFVVYLNSAPVYDGEPTERDTEILMYTFIGKHSDKFVCSDLKTGPKATAEEVPLPSFLEEDQ